MYGREIDSSCPGYEPAPGSCVKDNKTSVSIKCGVFIPYWYMISLLSSLE
jgi:hypothetical protein